MKKLIVTNDCEIGSPISGVDLERLLLIKQLEDQKQKEIFLLGMCFYSAYLVFDAIITGRPVSTGEIDELKSVIQVLDRNNLFTKINDTEDEVALYVRKYVGL